MDHFWFDEAGLACEGLSRQYVLSRSEGQIPRGWARHRQRGWTLGVSNLPVASVENRFGEVLGWCVGYPLVAGGSRPSTVVLDTAHTNVIESESINRFYETVAGRWVLIVLARKEERLYLDPYGSLGTVYRRTEPTVASTPTLLGSEHSWDYGLINALGMPESGLWFPGTLTARVGVRRLLPNHALDLIEWHAARHWPRDLHDLAVSAHVPDTVNTIAASLKSLVSLVVAHVPTYLTLTGGRDTRMLLACAKAHLPDISFFTLRDGNTVTVDTHLATKLARRHALDHFFLRVRYATRQEQRDWLSLTGHAVSGDIWRIHKTLEGLETGRALLPGIGGEVGRAFYWRDGDAPHARLMPFDLLERSGMPSEAALVGDIETWLTGLAGLTALDVLDLYYLEHRLGGWAAPAHYGNLTSLFELSPFNQRAVFASMLKLPYEYRWNKQLSTDICRSEWPALLALPFNEFTGSRRVFQSAVARGKDALYPAARPVKRRLGALLKRARLRMTRGVRP
ncbi:MAG: hypothetical protein WEG40_02285 [Candidatus Rokuibacteriota bacterium]